MPSAWYTVVCALAVGAAANPVAQVYPRASATAPSQKSFPLNINGTIENPALFSSTKLTVGCVDCHIQGNVSVTSKGITLGNIENDAVKLAESAAAEATKIAGTVVNEATSIASTVVGKATSVISTAVAAVTSVAVVAEHGATSVLGDATSAVASVGKTLESSVLGIFKEKRTFEDDVADVVGLDLDIEFENVSASFLMDIEFSDAISQTINILTYPVFGLDSGDGHSDNIGVMLMLDLIVNITGKVDFTTGFSVDLGPSNKLTLDAIKGTFTHDFAKPTVKALPSNLTDADITFEAILRATLEVGTTINAGKGEFTESAGIEAAVFVDFAHYKANVTENSGSGNNCTLALNEGFSVEAGAYADVNENLSLFFHKGVNLETSKNVTLVDIPLPSKCVKKGAFATKA